MRKLGFVLVLSVVAAVTACEDDAGPNTPPDAALDGPAVPDAAADTPASDDANEAGGLEAGQAETGEARDMGESGSPADAGPDGSPVAVVSITPAGPSIVPGGTFQMRAVAIHVDGSISDVTAQATWSSSRPSVATVSASGLVSALLTGETEISATYQGVVGSTHFTVTTVATTGITIAPASATVAHGETRRFTAILGFSNGTSQDWTEMAQWSIEHPTIATVSNQDGQRGLVEAVAAGQTTLRAVAIGHTGTATVTVTGH
jgi:uncharacterized protein YjdB